MAFALKTKKSAGIRVTSAVHRLIAQANAARDEGRWDDAAAAYEAVLASAPALHHIRLQRGHALKEAGRLVEADLDYAEASRLRPEDVEPLIHRAYLLRRTSGDRDAARLLAAELIRRPDRTELAEELARLIEPVETVPPGLLPRALEEGGAAAIFAAPLPAGTVDGGHDRRVFDITDLIGHFRRQRLPNGIERVQIEILRSALDRSGAATDICCFIAARDGWIGVPASIFRDLAGLATSGSDPAEPAWQLARARLFLHLALADDYTMSLGAVLLNLGTSWWVHDYFRHVRNAKAQRGIRYVPLIYDLIPVLASQYCLPDITRNFVGWVIGALRHADGFMAISSHSRDDLLRVAERLGVPLTADRVEVIPLDADFRHAADPLPSAALATWDLADLPFALLVSTIEPRKNHALVFDAWSVLLRRHGPAKVPRLVCVGRDGWLNDPVFARLSLDPLLAGHVTLVQQVSDAELALLYRSCRFTVYPSLYEGWGLPVTEALCHGRVPIVADSSSLPEAGGDLALMFASGSIDALIAAIECAAFDDRWREVREAAIAARFAPRRWEEVAEQVNQAVTRLLGSAGSAVPAAPEVRCGEYYPTVLHHQSTLPRHPAGGEAVRVGDGWLWPSPAGCRTTPAGGDVRLRVIGAEGPLRVHLRLQGLASVDCPVRIVVGGRVIARANMPAGKIRWLSCDLDGPELAFVLHGDASETVDTPGGPRAASITLCGMLPVDPEMARESLLHRIDQAAERERCETAADMA